MVKPLLNVIFGTVEVIFSIIQNCQTIRTVYETIAIQLIFFEAKEKSANHTDTYGTQANTCIDVKTLRTTDCGCQELM